MSNTVELGLTVLNKDAAFGEWEVPHRDKPPERPDEEKRKLDLYRNVPKASDSDWIHKTKSQLAIGGGRGLSGISDKLSSVLTQSPRLARNQRVRYAVDWNPHAFMQRNYYGYVDIATVISINSDGEAYEACTIGEYIARVWPTTGLRFLDVIRTWWRHISNGHREKPLQRMSNCRPYFTLD